MSQISWSVHSTFLPENMEQTKNAERCAKYRSVNKEKFQLVAAKQQFKRSKELASGTPEAEIFPKH